MTISCACSLETRRQYLANLFVDLLADQSRWVRMSAFQQLGPFISTFADPRLTGIYVAEDGSIVLQEGWSVAFNFFYEYDEWTEQKKDCEQLVGGGVVPCLYDFIQNHTLSIDLWHLPPNSTKTDYATEGAQLVSTHLTTSAVSALKNVRSMQVNMRQIHPWE